MSWLLFLDESGHDHRSTPYEVRGGIALRDAKLWPFVRSMKDLEIACFGDSLHRYGKEVKGHRLLDKDRFKWAAQGKRMDEATRKKHSKSYLVKGLEKDRIQKTREEFTAYGQACLLMARQVFELLRLHEAQLFAVAIPRGAKRPRSFEADEFLRKDHVFLFERYFYFLRTKQAFGLLVMDESDKARDRKFVRQLERYFTDTHPGRDRIEWIVPSPFFVASDMTYPVQAADVCIYCVNFAFRKQSGMDAPTRAEIATEFNDRLDGLQYKGEGSKGGEKFDTYGIKYVPNPYGSRGE